LERKERRTNDLVTKKAGNSVPGRFESFGGGKGSWKKEKTRGREKLKGNKKEEGQKDQKSLCGRGLSSGEERKAHSWLDKKKPGGKKKSA